MLTFMIDQRVSGLEDIPHLRSNSRKELMGVMGITRLELGALGRSLTILEAGSLLQTSRMAAERAESCAAQAWCPFEQGSSSLVWQSPWAALGAVVEDFDGWICCVFPWTFESNRLVDTSRSISGSGDFFKPLVSDEYWLSNVSVSELELLVDDWAAGEELAKDDREPSDGDEGTCRLDCSATSDEALPVEARA